jgi:hypothetical protein
MKSLGHLLCVVALAVCVSAGCGRPLSRLAETTEPVATIVVSGGSAGEALGMSLVEGVVSFRDARYRVTFRGVESSSSSTGGIYNMAYVRDLEGTYAGSQGGRVRNERGIEIVFTPPLPAPDGTFQIRFDGRITPKDNVSGSRSGD